MDLIVLAFIILISVLAGVVATLVFQWRLFNQYISNQPYVGPSTKPIFEQFSLPKGIVEEVGGKEPAGALNALLQFLFQEIRNTKRVRKWFRNRLSLELDELLTRTTTGKLFESIILRDLHLGSHLPAIRSVEVKTLNVDSATKLIEDVELCLDLEYSGGFQLSIDAHMRLSKAAHVSVKVNELTGQARLQFTRKPYTHWCFSFYSEPTLDLSVESQFQGRSLPQVNSIIANQIRKAIRRKHTLPYYKIRYKPFFVKSDLESNSDEKEDPFTGILEVTVIESTRLTESSGPVFCNLAIDSTAWIEMTQSGTANYLTVDITITKTSGQPLGISFKQEFIPDKYQVGVVVDSVNGNVNADVRLGDIITSIDGKPISSLAFLNKIINKNSSTRLTLRLERKIKSSVINSDDKNQLFSETCIRHRSGSGDNKGDKTDSDSSNPPSLSADRTDIGFVLEPHPSNVALMPIAHSFTNALYALSIESPAKKPYKISPEHFLNRSSIGSEVEFDLNKPFIQSSKDVPYSRMISFNEAFRFQVLPEHRYLNLSLWGRGTDKNTLLGHVSVPIVSFCNPSMVGHRIRLYALLPPGHSFNNSGDSLASHPGFEPCLCYGDVLLSFLFNPSSSPTASSGPSVPASPSPLPPVTITTVPPESPSTPTPPGPEHDFVRTHFNRVTQCGFCFKKIWLKDALQCQGCLMTCHKKCASKCQAALPGCAKSATPRPEIITTAPEEMNQGDREYDRECWLQSGRTLAAILASVTPRGLKRTGSGSSLAPPGLTDLSSSGSISLPPSPNHSPSPSRKTSLVESGLFLNDPTADEINQAVELLLARPHDENVMDLAKASGKLLFADLPPELRKKRIDDVMDKLKEAMDSESHSHQALVKEEQANDESESKAKLAFLVGKSEERLRALTVLMLHCCAGLQDHQESTMSLPQVNLQ